MSQREPFRSQYRPVPDYFRRSTRLRLFLMVAACMFVLAIAERSRDPATWPWRWDVNRPRSKQPLNVRLLEEPAGPADAGTFLSTAAPPALAPAEPPFDPVARAWQQGWKDVFQRLQPAERELLFAMLYGVSRRQALPVEKTELAADLAARLTTLWDDYQAAAFEAVTELKGDEQAQWIDVLRQTKGRFAGLRAAVQSVIDGRTPTTSEERGLKEWSETLLALAKAQIQDDTVFRPAEREIWFHMLAEVRDRTSQELASRSSGRLAYLQLYNQPSAYRGQVVSVKGTVRWAYRRQAPANYLGIEQYFVYWIHPAGGPDSPIVVYALAAPPGFPALKDKDLDAGLTDLREEVEVTGVFYKRWAYPGQDGTYTAPLIVANAPTWQRHDLDLAAGRAVLTPEQLIAAVVAALLMATGATIVLWRRTRRRPSAALAPFNPAALQDMTLAKTPRESLGDLERQAKRHGN